MATSDKDGSQTIQVSFVTLANVKKWVFIRESGLEPNEADFAELKKVWHCFQLMLLLLITYAFAV